MQGAKKETTTTMPTITDDTMTSEEKKKEEQEIMRLLGISDEEEKEPVAQIKTQKVMDPDLNKKDMQMQDLMNENRDQKKKIIELEQEINALKMRSGARSIGSNEYKAKYDQALSLYMNRDYNGAMAIYKELLALSIEHPLSDNCQYWLGECYFGLKMYRQSLVEFEKVFVYTKTEKDDDSQLKLGRCYQMLGEKQKAIEEYNRLLTNYPSSEFINTARSYIQKLR